MTEQEKCAEYDRLTDQTPLTEECLRECGFRIALNTPIMTQWNGSISGVMFFAFQADGQSSCRLTVGSNVAKNNPTNGDLRMLCRVLGGE